MIRRAKNNDSMDLKDQLKKLFPDHRPEEGSPEESAPADGMWLQHDPILCKYEKRKGKVITLLEGYQGTDKDLKQLASLLKNRLHVGGTVKNGQIILQGDYRDKIMTVLQELGFNTKRVGG